jgi:hypothetical protein
MPDTHPDQTEGEPTEGVRLTEPDIEPARQTVPDVEADASEAPPPHEEPEARDEPAPRAPRSWVYFLVGGLLFASVAGPLAFYFFVWRYRPTAPQHIPHGSTVVVRFDGRELYLYEPFRTHVMGALEDAPGLDSHVERIKSRTGINLREDVREIVFATTTGQSFVVLLGGKLGKLRAEQDRFPQGVYAVLAEKGLPGFAMAGDVMTGPGFRLAQADDDTVIIGTDDEIVRAALEPSDTWKSLGLASSGAMSFVIDTPALARAAETAPSRAAAALGKTQRASGYLRLDKAKLYVELLPTEGFGSEALGQSVDAALDEARLMSLLLPDAYGAKGLLASARTKPRPETLMIEADWPREGIDDAMKQLGAALKTVLTGAAPP